MKKTWQEFSNKELLVSPSLLAADFSNLESEIKCIEEAKTGNKEFISAEQSLTSALNSMHLEEVSEFLRDFLPSYSLTLDELQ